MHDIKGNTVLEYFVFLSDTIAGVQCFVKRLVQYFPYYIRCFWNNGRCANRFKGVNQRYHGCIRHCRCGLVDEKNTVKTIAILQANDSLRATIERITLRGVFEQMLLYYPHMYPHMYCTTQNSSIVTVFAIHVHTQPKYSTTEDHCSAANLKRT